jgi:DNA-directed RNA polymerase specialized sigma24 family protein
MRQIINSTAEALLVRSFAFEPALRAQLRRDGTEAARIDEVLQEVYARLLIAAEAGRVRVRHLRAVVFTILAEVVRSTPPPEAPGGARSPAGRQSLVSELSSEAGRSFTSSLRGARKEPSARYADRNELRRLVALAACFPMPQRHVFTLRKVYGLRPSDIAQVLNLTEHDIERHLIAAALACARHCFDPDRPITNGTTADP